MTDPLQNMARDLADMINYEIDDSWCSPKQGERILKAFLDQYGEIVTDYTGVAPGSVTGGPSRALLVETIQREVGLEAAKYVVVRHDPDHPDGNVLRDVFTGTLIVLVPGGAK